MLLLSAAADVGERKHDHGETRRGGFFRRRDRRPGRLADLQRVDPDRLNDVLELGEAEIAGGEIEAPSDLPIGVLGKADRAGLGDPLEPRGNIDALAHQVAVGFFDHVAEMHADAEIDASVVRHANIALDEAFCIAMAEPTASTTLRNSAMSPSPVRLTTRP